MLEIRAEQMEAFSKAMRCSFVEHSVLRVRKEHASLLDEQTEVELADLFGRAVDRADEYGIDDEEDVFQFALRELCWAVDFDQQPELAALNHVFTDPDIEDAERMTAFIDLEAKLSPDPDAN